VAIALRSANHAVDAWITSAFGPPGLGKTYTRNHHRYRAGVGYQQTRGPPYRFRAISQAILTILRRKQLLFLDEFHRLKQTVIEEKRYTALEDYKSISSSVSPRRGRESWRSDPSPSSQPQHAQAS